MVTQLKRMVWQGSLLALLVALLAFGFVRAEGEGPAFTGDGVEAQLASGSLDPTFSGDGAAFANFGGSERTFDVAVQPDGKIVLVGDEDADNFALARFNPNGTLDTTFSGDGKQTTNFGGSDVAYGVALQSDGKIVVSGESERDLGVDGTSHDLAVARYNPDGTLDTTFSGDGKRIIDVGLDIGVYGNGTSGDIGIQADGKIVMAGYVRKSNLDFIVYRLNTNGTLDASFGGTGTVSFGFGADRQDRAFDLILQGGKIIAVGQTCDNGWGNCDFAIARIRPNGTLDTTFSGDGKARTNLGGEESGLGLARQADGRIVAVGATSGTSGNVFAVARYNPDGTLDTSLNGTGKRKIAFGDSAGARDVKVLGNGKLVIVGATYDGTDNDVALVRLNSNGSLDNTFSGDGKAAYTSGGTNNDSGLALALQADGKYLLAVSTHIDGSDLVVLRVLP
jgi:uncharacterized delta-60 repeat protein